MSSLNSHQPHFGYWRSLAELENTPEFQESQRKEFLSGIPGDFTSVSRRRFVQLMGASAALATGMAGCRWEKEQLVPFRSQTPGMVPGDAVYYATMMEIAGVAAPLLVTSFNGRPIKVDGNPDHPISSTFKVDEGLEDLQGKTARRLSYGAAGLFAQASILELYDPDRTQQPYSASQPDRNDLDFATFARFARDHFSKLKTSGKKLAVLSEATSSPTLLALKASLLAKFPGSEWYEYEPLSSDNEPVGLRLCFGQPLRPLYKLNKAKVIACFDADLFGQHPASIPYTREYAQGRDPEKKLNNRLYVVESNLTNTGAAADHRLPLKSSSIHDFLLALEQAVVADAKFAPASGTLQPVAGAEGLVKDEAAKKFLKAIAGDLVANAGACVVAVGANQPPVVHAIAQRLNLLLGNAGQTVEYIEIPEADRTPHFDAIKKLTGELKEGKIDTLLMLGGNPVFDAPVDLDFAAALPKASTSLHLTLYRNETSLLSTWSLPRAHYLEAWGDGRAYDGSLLIQQPLIQPLYAGKSPIELLSLIVGDAPLAGFDLVRQTFQKLTGFTDTLSVEWNRAIHAGFHLPTKFASVTPTLVAGFQPQAAQPKAGGAGLEVTFVSSPQIYDGRFANNSWLQEVPDFLTKLTWDNALFIGPATAKKLGIINSTMVKLSYLEHTLDIVAYVLPGIAPDTIVLPVGYGRTAAGRVAGNAAEGIPSVGFNTYKVRHSTAPFVGEGATVTSVGTKYALAVTQDHFAIDTIGLEAIGQRVGTLVREATVEEYEHHPDAIQHMGVHVPQHTELWQEWEYNGHKWGMGIDLNKCVGCNACIVACQAENNIPVVGKDQILRGREMHWLRMDRYFKGPADNPQVASQPMSCQQCENAPCEQVCPVAATIHSHEGLNDMVYNRCVGTRYCSNNCPYKVRRFNFYYFHKEVHEPDKTVLQMAFNPEVTVRTRGVMEKCTYCVQRIQKVKIEAKNAQRPIGPNELQSACSQACPAQAITFGDLNNAESLVAQAHANPRSYTLLDELRTKPRTKYLARIRNPHPDLTDGNSQPHAH